MSSIWQSIEPGLIRHNPSGIYYVRKFKDGKRLTATTGTDKLTRARTIRDEMLAEWISGKAPDRKKRIHQVCDELELVLEKEFANGDRRKRTFDHDKTYLPIIKKYFGNYQASEIDEKFWADWVRDTGRSLNRTLNDIAKYLSKVLTHAYQQKYINRKPSISNPDKQKKIELIYENDEIERFIDNAEPDLKDLILIGAECGLRPHENHGLKWEWISFERNRVIITIPESYSKTKKARSLEASENAAVCLRRRYLKQVGPYVFPSPKDPLKPISSSHLRKLWGRMKKNAGITAKIKFHWLRHSFFTKALLDAQEPIQKVAEYGGNSPAILMDRYLKNDPARTRSVAGAVKLNIGEKLAKNLN